MARRYHEIKGLAEFTANGEKVMCPKCNKDYLIPLHKKRKDNDDLINKGR